VWLGAAFLLLALVIALHCWLVWVGPLPGDRWAAARGAVWPGSPWAVRDAGQVIQDLCTPVPALALAALGLLLLLRRGWPGEAEGLVVAGAATVACALLKTIFGPTPLWAMLHPGTVSNYPSGHVTFVTATVGYLGLCAWRHHARPISAIAAALILWVGPERVLSGAHAVSDVIAGYMLGAAFLILAELCAKSRFALLAPR
jgi:undecaprenyl-diphosphatase